MIKLGGDFIGSGNEGYFCLLCGSENIEHKKITDGNCPGRIIMNYLVCEDCGNMFRPAPKNEIGNKANWLDNKK
ncbi:hypothetical protein COX25_03860 [bacterium (Candidatus Howlettbacteria) CG23_combo_of_CG06-09_8_20_14_all_37_9]|nr:MAG: hypothetical protein COX25_03860 [bacterium (Candidatus Howlettbacteria) CG23_combo_of_CG06-09_8_20_14_all_37_9]